MKLIIIVAIVIIVILIVYLVYLLYNNYFNSRIESSIKNNELEVENSDKKIHKTDNKLHINKSTNTRNLTMTINHNNSNYLIEIELFDKEVPLTCKNFREIAFKGINGKTYNNSIFHRVIKRVACRYMVLLLEMKILNLNMTKVAYYQWQIQDQIQMVHNFL